MKTIAAPTSTRLRPLRLHAGAAASGLLAAAVIASGCTSDSQAFTPVADMKDLMISVLEPAAEAYWDGVGEILDEEGVHEIRPQTDEDWAALRNAAFVVAESGNLLMVPGRARDHGQWLAFAQAMTESGLAAIRAADNRDTEAVFDAGAEIYYACANCHVVYAAETLRPSDARSEAGGGADEASPPDGDDGGDD